MKNSCFRFTAFILSFILVIAALPMIAVAETTDVKSPFSNITCVYDRSTSKIKLEYRMKSEDVKKYSGCEIKLYALSASQSVNDINAIEPKVTGLSPSNRAGAEVRCEGLYDRLSSYVFAMQTDDGLICSEPILPAVSSSRPDLPFKGIETDSTALTIGTSAGTVIIDIHTDSLISNGSGYLYPTTDRTYTFSSTYLKGIDDLIMLYRGAGRRVLFRLDSPDIYAGRYENQRTVYACVSFLYSRYSSEKFGGINGFVLGSDEFISPEIANAYCRSLYAAAAGLNDLGTLCPIIVPISENIAETTEFLDIVVDKLGESPMFTLMLESHRSPYGINNDYIHEFDENDDVVNSELKPSNSSSAYISAENLTRLTRLIERRYKRSIYQDIIYHWTLGENVTGEAAVAAYVYNYYALSQLGRTVSFIISPSDQMDKSFIDTVKYINTDLREDTINEERILSLFNFNSWEEHFSRLDQNKLLDMTVKRKLIQYGTMPRFVGTVDYFNFSSSSDISGWYAGQNCNGVYSDATEIGKSFNARLNFPEKRIPGSAFVSYTYTHSESFKYTDYIAIELSVESETNDSAYDITVSIGGDGFLYEYFTNGIPAGSRRTLYLDVREFDESKITDFLRVTVEPSDGEPESARLCLYSVTANSLINDSETLKAYILAERERLKSDGVSSDDDAIDPNAVLFLVVVLIATALVMITIARRQKKQRLNQ